MAQYGGGNGEQGGIGALYLIAMVFHGVLAMVVLPNYLPASVEPGLGSFFAAVVVFVWFFFSGLVGNRFLSGTDDGHYYAIGGMMNLLVGIVIWGGYIGLRAISANVAPIQMNTPLWIAVLAVAVFFVLCAYSSITKS